MKKYQVNVKRIEWGWVEVEAESKEDAKRIVLDEKYIIGMVKWGDEELEVEDVKELK